MVKRQLRMSKPSAATWGLVALLVVSKEVAGHVPVNRQHEMVFRLPGFIARGGSSASDADLYLPKDAEKVDAPVEESKEKDLKEEISVKGDEEPAEELLEETADAEETVEGSQDGEIEETVEEVVQVETVEEEVFYDAVEEEPTAEQQESTWAASEEAEPIGDQTVVQYPEVSDNVDEMELADAYDEGDTTPGSFEPESSEHSANEGIPEPTPDISSIVEEPLAVVEEDPIAEEAEEAAGEGEPAELTEAMKTMLIKELNYRRKEVNVMKPAIARIVSEKKLQRPVEGIPLNWYIPGLEPKKARSLLGKKLVPRVVIPCVTAVAAVIFGPRVLELLPSFQSDEPNPIDGVEADPFAEEIAAFVENVSEEPSSEVEPEAVVASEKVVTTNEHTNFVDEVHPHSVKPGKRPAEELDVTWLDKAITAVERRIKAFFRLEI